ncbi:MAG: CHAT domain-containing protein [Chloroflexota bacterium]
MHKHRSLLVAAFVGLLLVLVGLSLLPETAAAQTNTRTPTNTKTPTATRTPSPTPLGGIDAQTKFKITNDITQNLNKGDVGFINLKFDDANTAFTAALDSVRKYKVNDAFINDRDTPQMLNFEFRALVGLGRSAFGKVVAPVRPTDISERAFDNSKGTDESFAPMTDYFTQAVEVAKSLPDKLQGKGWMYWTWGQSYIVRANSLMTTYNSANFFAAFRTEPFRAFTFKSLDMFTKAANAFGLVGDTYRQSAAYWHLGVNEWLFEGTDYGGVSAIEWYKKVAQAHKDGKPGGYGYGWDHPCQSEMEFIQRLDNGSIKDDTVNIVDLMNDLAAQANTCANANEWRGVANAMLAWRKGDPVLAQKAISDLRPAISQILGDRSWIGGQIFSNYVTYTAYSTHYLGRMYSLIGTQPDLALYYLQQAEIAFARTDPPPNLAPPLGMEWEGTQAQLQNMRLIGDNLVLLGRPREAIEKYQTIESRKDFETNVIYPDVLAGLANAYQKLGMYGDSIDPLTKRRAYYEKAIKDAQAQATPDTDLIKLDQTKLIDTNIQLSIPLAVLGRTEEALTGLQQAVDQATAIDDQVLLINTTLRVGDVYLQLDSEDNAISSYSHAADLADQAKPKLSQQLGRALLGLGQLQLKRDLLKDAKDSLTKANQSAQSARDVTSQVKALTALGDLALKGDKPSASGALNSYNQALNIATNAKDPRLSIEVLEAQAALQAQTDAAAATITYYRALVFAQQIGNKEAIARLYARIGQITAASNEPTVATQSFANAVNQVEATQRGFQSESLTSQFAANYAWIYADYLKLLISQKRYDEAFAIAERARARAFLDQLAVGPVDLRKGASADLLQKDNALRQNVEALRGLFTAAQSDNPPDKERITRLRTQLQQAESDYAALFARMQATDPTLTTLTAVEVAPVAQIQAALEADTTLLSYYTTDTQTYAFIITKSNFALVSLDVTQPQLNDAITRFRADEKQAAGLDDLSKWLIQPLVSQLTTKRLIVAPHNVLNYLPFAALPVDASHLLGENYAISYTPSANALLHLPEKVAKPGDLLALGNPVSEGFKPLPFAEDEVKQVTSIIGGQVYIGSDAKEAEIWQKGSQAGVLYIAAHGTFNQRNPLFSALHLTPGDGETGELDAYKIYRLDLTQKTELVVLSGCETAVGKLSAGDEFSGLNRAFLYAGAPNVLASLWSVDDKATGLLMKAFFEARAKGMGITEALQSAQATVRTFKDSDGKTPYASPYYWAPFILTGRG